MSSVNRGDVVQLSLTRGARGHEQKGSRLAVVVQSNALPLSTAIVAPTSTRALATDFRPEVSIRRRRMLVMCDQLRALDLGRLGQRVGRLAASELDEVDRALRLTLGLDLL